MLISEDVLRFIYENSELDPAFVATLPKAPDVISGEHVNPTYRMGGVDLEPLCYGDGDEGTSMPFCTCETFAPLRCCVGSSECVRCNCVGWNETSGGAPLCRRGGTL